MSSVTQADKPVSDKSPTINYGLRYAKNIERKMMGEAFARLSALSPLTSYQYVGFGSEFFNDFSLYHQTLGIRSMVSIEKDISRIDRCRFNLPYKCIELLPGEATEVLPNIDWKPRTIVWLDYLGKLDKSIAEDIQFVTSRVRSGSLATWTVNANPWNKEVSAPELPRYRMAKLRELFAGRRKFSDLNGADLGGWGLASQFHLIIVDEIQQALNNRNAATADKDKLTFRQCFHFRYADNQKMLTVGGLFLNAADSAKLGTEPFADLEFVRSDSDSYVLSPPTLTGREVRDFNRRLPSDSSDTLGVSWLTAEEATSFRKVYRYYPIFAESEL